MVSEFLTNDVLTNDAIRKVVQETIKRVFREETIYLKQE